MYSSCMHRNLYFNLCICKYVKKITINIMFAHIFVYSQIIILIHVVQLSHNNVLANMKPMACHIQVLPPGD